MNSISSVLAMSVLALLSAVAIAQTPEVPAGQNFERAANDIQRKLESSLQDLAKLREEVLAEKLPLGKSISEAEADLSKARTDHRQITRDLDGRALELNNLRTKIKEGEDEVAYLSTLLRDYNREVESRMHIAETKRYEGVLKAAKLASENSKLSKREALEAEVAVLTSSLDRLMDSLGGTHFEGQAIDPTGTVHKGTFVVFGPAAVFASTDGKIAGTAETRIGSLEPAVEPFVAAENAQAATQIARGLGGSLPLDPTLGNARKVESINETLVQHIKRGGPVMVPIFVLAVLALLVALYKWISLSVVRNPGRKPVGILLEAVASGQRSVMQEAAERIRGPAGRMLRIGVEHVDEPRELIEEVMYERSLQTKLSLHRWLPFIAITSSSAPLLGLLGTVTGIMNTFSLMTVFGTGDVKTLSSGISEALITTEYGLYVAIPSLLLYAFLSRKAKKVMDGMEQSAVSFLNAVDRAANKKEREARPRPEEQQHEMNGNARSHLRLSSEVRFAAE